MNAIKIDDHEKIQILLKLIEENRKQAEWVKELDFKVVYYTVVFTTAAVAWLATTEAKKALAPILCNSSIFLCVVALLLLGRNHISHATLNREYRRVVDSLSLTKKSTYGKEAVVPKFSAWQHLTFHGGRSLYFGIVALCGYVAVTVISKLSA